MRNSAGRTGWTRGARAGQPAAATPGSIERDGANFIDVDGSCTLSDAITAANTNGVVANSSCEAGKGDGALDVIRLMRNVSLTSSTAQVTTRMLVEGMGRTVSVASGSTGVRLFQGSTTADLTLRDITLRGGNAGQGPAVHSRGKLTMENCVVRDNTSAANEGGALYLGYDDGETTINRCAFIDNTTQWYGGAIDLDNDATLDHQQQHIQRQTMPHAAAARFISKAAAALRSLWRM